MNANEYQELALRTCPQIASEDKILNGAMGLCGESGEVMDLIKKWKFHEHILDKDKVIKELGDVCWYIAILSKGLGVDLSQVLEMNIEKLRKRYPEGFSKEKSLNREEDSDGR